MRKFAIFPKHLHKLFSWSFKERRLIMKVFTIYNCPQDKYKRKRIYIEISLSQHPQEHYTHYKTQIIPPHFLFLSLFVILLMKNNQRRRKTIKYLKLFIHPSSNVSECAMIFRFPLFSSHTKPPSSSPGSIVKVLRAWIAQ